MNTKLLRKQSVLLLSSVSVFALSVLLWACPFSDRTEQMPESEERTESLVPFQDKAVTDSTRPEIESIELKRRNWESHGADYLIDRDGSFTVHAQYLGKSKVVNQGKITPGQLERLHKIIEDINFFGLPAEYKAPFKTEWSWWGYELTVKTSIDSGSVRFHSEDETVPEKLSDLVETIILLTK